jgi:hypothetical protein
VSIERREMIGTKDDMVEKRGMIGMRDHSIGRTEAIETVILSAGLDRQVGIVPAVHTIGGIDNKVQ